MDDHDFTLVRKNLNILSVLILILAFTNAQLHKINLLGIDMDLDAIKLYQALFIGYLYFIWRFLTKLPMREGFWNDFEQYYINSEEGIKKQHNYKKYQQKFIDASERLWKAYELNDPSLIIVQVNVVRPSNSSLINMRLSAICQANVIDQITQSQQFSSEIDLKLSRFYLVRKILVFCLKYDKFGDYLFPLIPVLAVVGCFVFKSDWQGSFSGLFLRG